MSSLCRHHHQILLLLFCYQVIITFISVNTMYNIIINAISIYYCFMLVICCFMLLHFVSSNPQKKNQTYRKLYINYHYFRRNLLFCVVFWMTKRLFLISRFFAPGADLQPGDLTAAQEDGLGNVRLRFETRRQLGWMG